LRIISDIAVKSAKLQFTFLNMKQSAPYGTQLQFHRHSLDGQLYNEHRYTERYREWLLFKQSGGTQNDKLTGI